MDSRFRNILKGVSRSFYLSLRFLPSEVRDTLSFAFLLCKIADTIADTELIPVEERLDVLCRYRDRLEILRSPQDDKTAESKLLAMAPEIIAAVQCLPPADQRHIFWLVKELTQGMITDLTFFSHNGTMKALPDEVTLDRYTYHVAGCVGRFWTRVLAAHYPFASAWEPSVEDIGERFGKGLQMVNILRDLPRDLQQGRCYLPLKKVSVDTMRPLLDPYLKKTRELLSDGRSYVARIPRHHIRLRSAVLVPMQLGFQTLDLLERSPTWLDPEHVIKVPRSRVYRTFFTSLYQSAGGA